MQAIWSPILSTGIPSVLGALLILLIGWLVAWLISNAVRKLLQRSQLDERIMKAIGREEAGPGSNQTEKVVARIVFWIIMIFVLVGFFQALNLTAITTPLNSFLGQIFAYVPKILGAAVLVLIAWLLATALRFAVQKIIAATKLEERLGDQAGEGQVKRVPLGKTLGNIVYWLVFLLFLPAILGALGLEGILAPVQVMLNDLLGFLPNLFAAAVIIIVGWFVARIVRRLVTSLLAAVGTDRLSEKIGLTRVLGHMTLSDLLGLIVYILILIPVIVAGLNALKLDSVTQPASNLLDQMLGALPNIFAAAVLLIISYVVGRLVAGLVANLLAGVGFDRLLGRLGMEKKAILTPGAAEPTPGEHITTHLEEANEIIPPAEDVAPALNMSTPSGIVGTLILVFIMLFAATEASRLLDFAALAVLIAEFTVFLGRVLLGLVIFGLGLYLANLAARAIEGSSARNGGLVATIARVSIMVLAGAMALRQMGLANEIINLAFGLLLGAVAVAAALAFGLGGREIAARELENWIRSRRQPPSGPNS